MNKINPRKLLNSKWTASAPQGKEKHFIVSELKLDEQGNVVSCTLEAVMTKRSTQIDWNELKFPERWAHGWN